LNQQRKVLWAEAVGKTTVADKRRSIHREDLNSEEEGEEREREG
jgi:hypothetical protein